MFTMELESSTVQMIEKPTAFASFLGRRSFVPRPLSTATDFFDLDIDSDLDDSPRSLASLDNGSSSTVSSREVKTPQSAGLGGFEFHFDHKPVQGPSGPHLFSSSPDSFSHEFEDVLHIEQPQQQKAPPQLKLTGRPVTALNRAVAELDESQVRSWTPRQVAEWMAESGFDASVVDKFLLHDISGRVLIDLQFEDLKELDISSFGKRHRVMSSIQHLRNSSLISLEKSIERPASKPPPRAPRTLQRSVKPEECQVISTSRSRSRRRGRQGGTQVDDVTPGESISIVAIEQLLPKPHKCSKGEDCPKWQKQQRKLQRIQQEFAAEVAEEVEAPNPDAIASVVGSSDALGPTVPFKITAERLSEVQVRDAQENVRQFLTFQHVNSTNLQNPSPPPAPSAAYNLKAHNLTEQLHDLPKLTIPSALPDAGSPWRTPIPAACDPTTAQEQSTAQLRGDPYHYGGVASPADIYRTETPFSAADVPVTAHPEDPCERMGSSSVPPDMRYGAGNATPASAPPRRRLTKHSFTAPTVTPVREDFASSSNPSHQSTDILNHAGWMRKRRTRMLRHEWTDNYFALDGTRLVMLDNESPNASTIEHIDVDDYDIHAYSLATASKLRIAFKKSVLGSENAMTSQPTFAFSLIPDGDTRQPRKIFEKNAKSHHFALHNASDKIEWMRRLMLAKAASRNGQGHHEI